MRIFFLIFWTFTFLDIHVLEWHVPQIYLQAFSLRNSVLTLRCLTFTFSPETVGLWYVRTCFLFSELGLLIVSQMETKDEGGIKYESIVCHFKTSSLEMV